MVTGAMARSRWIAVAVLSATFLAGAALGAATIRLLAEEKQEERPAAHQDGRWGERGPRTSVFDQIGLTPAQKEAVDSIMEKRRRDMDAFWKQHNPEVRGIVDSARVEIDRLLSEEQRQQFEQFRERRRKERSDGNGGRPGPGDSVRRPISFMEPRYL